MVRSEETSSLDKMVALAEKYPDYDGATNNDEIVIFPQAFYDMGADFSTEEKDRVEVVEENGARFRLFEWDGSVNPRN